MSDPENKGFENLKTMLGVDEKKQPKHPEDGMIFQNLYKDKEFLTLKEVFMLMSVWGTVGIMDERN